MVQQLIAIPFPGNTIPASPSGSVLNQYHAQCTNQLYPIYGSYQGNVYEKQFIAQSMRVDGNVLTGFGILIAKRGTPNDPLIIGLSLSGPPDNPLSDDSYLAQGKIYSYTLGSSETFYWVTFYLPQSIDISHATPWVTARTSCNYDPDIHTNDWVWGACNGVPSGLNSAEKWIPQTMGLGLESLDCQGPGAGICWSDGVDITQQPYIVEYNATPPYPYPLTHIVVGNYYKIPVYLHNGNPLLPENFTLLFYWDEATSYFGCYKDCVGFGGDSSKLIEFFFTVPSMVNGDHVLKVKMLEKPSVEFDIGINVEGGPYEWSAAPDTVSFFSYNQGTSGGCTNPIGSEGQWHCDGTTKMMCSGGQWIATPNSPDCQIRCSNPDGSDGATHCFGIDQYTCNAPNWLLTTPGATECAGCICGNYQNIIDCESATGPQEEECCWWYSKYFWEPASCHSATKDYMQEYLPVLAVVAGLGILVLAISTTGGARYVPYYPPLNKKRKR